MQDCIFCQIVQGTSTTHIIWEDEKHLAFLSIFPNTEGFSVVITKQHYPSYAFDAPENIYVDLLIAARKVGKLLDNKLDDVGRTGFMMEGFGVDHLHVKLFPMHGTVMKKWKPIPSNVDKFFDHYEGYMSSHNHKRADDQQLEKLAQKIRK